MVKRKRTAVKFPFADRTASEWLAERDDSERSQELSRRGFLGRLALVGAGIAGVTETVRRGEADQTSRATVSARESIKITKIETFVLKSSWVFIKISTDVGLVGW